MQVNASARKVQDLKPFPDLQEVLQYENQNVVDGLRKALDITQETAQELFKEGVKWLWYCCHPDTKNSRNIDNAMLIIDEVWHTFILYTGDYFSFCHRYFGRYIHHAPTTAAEAAKQRAESKKDRMLRKRKQYELIFDILGKETFIRWYHEYPEIYSRENILALRRK
ncbi:hypothetical protein [Planctobacterium marinum]|uniref:Uncharacterized protein n=1 Tax=Planctobacterium marinum TaxID=1631968 RepID=A0AA48HD91_9ALTE|nr:hypothetical protein MACH26_03890 [Planctobacterium marinum]